MSTIKNKDLKRRIIDISLKKKLSHLGSCLTAVDIIKEIYDKKKENEPFILSSGHAGLALYVVLEKVYGYNAELLFQTHGVHPNRDVDHNIYCSTGSLGHGVSIAVGAALANKLRNVYCLISDGECMEGSVWEALRIQRELKLDNLKVYLNYNGWGAYQEIYSNPMMQQLVAFGFDMDNVVRTDFDLLLPILKEPQEAHYVLLDKEKYDIVMKQLGIKGL